MKSYSSAGIKDGNVTHHFVTARLWQMIGLLALLVLLAGCGGEQTATSDPAAVVALTRLDGAATLARAGTGSRSALGDSVQLRVGDRLFTTADQSVTLQFPDGGTLRLEPDSQLLLYALRQADRLPIFRLAAGSLTADLRGAAYEAQAYAEAAKAFTMVVSELTVASRGAAGSYQLGFAGNSLQATITAGEFDVRSDSHQATLPAGWRASLEPGETLRLISLITPTPAPPSATEAPTATPIPIVALTPTDTPTYTPTATDTATPTPTSTRPRPRRTATSTPPPTLYVTTEVPTATPRPYEPPQPTNPPPTNPPPTVPPPTEPPPTSPPPTVTPRPTPGL
jgi:hypothetical protein